MALSVKAYLLILNSDQQEIRRFSIDDGASSNFDYLLTKIKTVFPAIRTKQLRLFWKDEDGELVTFSSDEELVEALGSIQGDVFRVYIRVREGQEDTQAENGQSPSDAEHVGVVCDGCDHGIFGTRFKCVVCPDYDLCMKCERKNLHKEHEMFRICTPRARPGCPGASFPFYFAPPSFAYHTPGCPPNHPPGFGPWGRGRGGHFRGGPWSGRGRCGGPRGRCGKAPEAKCEQHKEKTTDSNEVPVGPPFLHAMGEAIANFLGPMGIEVHTYADTEKDCCKGKCGCDHKEDRSEETATSQASTSQQPDNMDLDSQSTSSTPEKTEENPGTEDYVMVDKEKQKQTEKTDAATGTVPEPEDPLEVAIAQMQAMGFEDHDGWLSRLIVAKEYDIGKVLDAIQYNDKK